MKVECPKCGTQGQIPDDKVTEKGGYARCPNCKEQFFISKQPAASSPAAPPQSANTPDAAPSELSHRLRMEDRPATGESEKDPDVVPRETCSVCGNMFASDMMVKFGEKWVCALCKPGYVQMSQQGIRRPGEMVFAGFWMRFLAKFMDGLVIQASTYALGFLIGTAFAAPAPSMNFAAFGLNWVLTVGFGVAYSTFFIGKFRATPGKMACGLVVVRADGGDVSYLRALGRHFSEFISSIILLIGYIMAAFDQEKRALHDRICDTRVVRK